MLTSLSIKNFGLIDQFEIEFFHRLNVITGETGAGKSILIDALRYVLGEKLHSSQIRNSDTQCSVEAVFELSKMQINEFAEFAEYISEEQPTLIILRIHLPDGRIKNKINGFRVTTSKLKLIGNHLIDFHGPYEHQLLFSEQAHIKILDRLCKIKETKNDYQQLYNAYLNLHNELHKIHQLYQQSQEQLDLLKHQIFELEQVPLDTKKYSEIIQEHTQLNNIERLNEHTRQLINTLDDEQTGLNKTIINAFGALKALNTIDQSTTTFTEILSRIQDDSSELLSSLHNYLESISFEPEKTAEIYRIYDIYSEILRKYGPRLEHATIFYKTAKKKYTLLNNLEHTDKELQNKIIAAKTELEKKADLITKKRKVTANILEQTIKQELKELGIIHIEFECRIIKTELYSNGQDKIVFYISPNAGEDLKPLSQIVSSGEAARVMLALKKALTKVDPIGTLIFDEIDAQIGGRLGTITGKKLKELSKHRQLILITHLPQIASFADKHFKVIKDVKNQHTNTKIILLSHEQKIEELAKMMSGEEKSNIALTHAKDMLKSANL